MPMRAFYALAYSALGMIFPFLPLVAARAGASGAEVGRLMALPPAVALLGAPLWGALADALGERTRLLRLTALGAALATLTLLGGHSVGALTMAVLLFAFFRAPLITLADATTFGLLGAHGERFGLTRVWGSIGYAAGALLVGCLQGRTQPLVIAAALGFAGSSAATCLLPVQRKAERPLWVFPRLGPRLVVLLGASMLHCAAHAAYDSTFSLHLARLGLGPSFLGLCTAAAMAVEIAAMLAVPKLLRRVSAARLLPCTAVGAALRWALLHRLRTSAAVLATQSLHAISFGAWYLALGHAVQQEAAPSQRASVQGLAGASIALGTIVGSLHFGARLPDGPAAYLDAALIAAASALLYVLSGRVSSAACRTAARASHNA